VNVGADLVALGMFHVGYLLGKAAGSEKLNARFVIIGSADQGNWLQAMGDGFDKAIFHETPLLFHKQQEKSIVAKWSCTNVLSSYIQ